MIQPGEAGENEEEEFLKTHFLMLIFLLAVLFVLAMHFSRHVRLDQQQKSFWLRQTLSER